MITEKEFLKAKEIYFKYKSQFKKNAGRKKIKFNNDEKIEKLNFIFSKNKKYKYSEMINEIQVVFNVGIIKSKKIINELQKEKFIKKNGNRSNYEKNY